MPDTALLNYRWSVALVAGFAAAGVGDAVISPGSRSTPFALALLRRPGLRVHVVLDERSAAFFGLGIAKANRRPVLLLATSGTAPANWLPAIVEASQAGLPLIALSADRPPEQQACGANQTIDQFALFAPFVRARHALGTPHAGFSPRYLHGLAAQACEQALWPDPGPVHINQPFREPLVPGTDCAADTEQAPPVAFATPSLRPPPARLAEVADMLASGPGIVVCGELAGGTEEAAAIARLAHHLACPVLAEALSGLRFGEHDRSALCVRYAHWPDEAEAVLSEASWVLRFGAYPVGRPLQRWLASAAGPHILIDARPRHPDPQRLVRHLLRGDVAATCDELRALIAPRHHPAWLPAFHLLEEGAAHAPEDAIVASLLDALPDGCALFVGNSLAIRRVDAASGHAGKRLRLFANRGASGIDGNVSTAAGLAAALGQTVAFIGDLTCQHDLGGLAACRERDIVIVVVNNGGGGIFEQLPQRALPEFETAWHTPQHIDFRHAAATFGLGYRRAEGPSALRAELAAAIAAGGACLLELAAP